MDRRMSKILESLHIGDSISTADLKFAASFLKPLVAGLVTLRDERYRLMIDELKRDLNKMEEFLEARKTW